MAAKSQMQQCVTLSVTEAEYVAATSCVQDMLYVRKLLNSIGHTVKKPMVLEMDNKGAIDLMNNWTSGGQRCHVDVRHHFMRELKEEGILKLKWISMFDMSSDIFTKNTDGQTFERHSKVYVDEM